MKQYKPTWRLYVSKTKNKKLYAIVNRANKLNKRLWIKDWTFNFETAYLVEYIWGSLYSIYSHRTWNKYEIDFQWNWNFQLVPLREEFTMYNWTYLLNEKYAKRVKMKEI